MTVGSWSPTRERTSCASRGGPGGGPGRPRGLHHPSAARPGHRRAAGLHRTVRGDAGAGAFRSRGVLGAGGSAGCQELVSAGGRPGVRGRRSDGPDHRLRAGLPAAPDPYRPATAGDRGRRGLADPAVPRLWVAHHDIDGETVRPWTVLDPNGRLLACIDLPPRLAPLDAGTDYLLGQLRDARGACRAVSPGPALNRWKSKRPPRRSAGAGASCPAVSRIRQSDGGSRTASITWITPLLARTSATATIGVFCAPAMATVPSLICTVNVPP